MGWLKNLIARKEHTLCDDCEIKAECIGIPEERGCRGRLQITRDADGVIIPPTREQKLFYGLHVMPCCHTTDFFEGPSGGLSTNIECCNCGKRWNITPLLQLIERI